MVQNVGCLKENTYLCNRKSEMNALLAQLVEHLTLNQGVEGSNPSSRTKALFLVDLVAGDGVFLLLKSCIVL